MASKPPHIARKKRFGGHGGFFLLSKRSEGLFGIEEKFLWGRYLLCPLGIGVRFRFGNRFDEFAML